MGGAEGFGDGGDRRERDELVFLNGLVERVASDGFADDNVCFRPTDFA